MCLTRMYSVPVERKRGKKKNLNENIFSGKINEWQYAWCVATTTIAAAVAKSTLTYHPHIYNMYTKHMNAAAEYNVRNIVYY